MKGIFTGEQLLWLVLFLFLIDLFMLVMFFLFYFRLKRFLNLPWDEIIEGIERARKLVAQLEKLKEGQGTRSEVSGKRLKDKVIELYNKGVAIKEIARRLKLSEGEVELIIATQKLGR